MSVNSLNEIISIFLHRNVNELSDNDLSTAIGNKCTVEDIHQVVQSFGSSLFQLQCNKKGIYLVRIEPKVEIVGSKNFWTRTRPGPGWLKFFGPGPGPGLEPDSAIFYGSGPEPYS